MSTGRDGETPHGGTGASRISDQPGSAAPRRILIVRLSAIGDILFASPLIGALRRAHPDAYLAWLVQPEYLGLLAAHPDLDEVIECPLGRWRALARERRFGVLRAEVGALRARLRARRFDLALDLQGLLKSGALAWLSGAPERIGLGSRELSGWLMTHRVARGGAIARIGSEYLHLARTLHLPVDDFSMALYPGEEARAFATRTIADMGLAWEGEPSPHAPAQSECARQEPARRSRAGARPGQGYVALCPFTTRLQKHWFEERWSALADALWERLALRPVLLGAPADRAASARIAAACAAPLVDLTGQTRLTEAAALIERAALLVGVDTGLGHMGIVFGRPSLLLFGATRPYLDTTRANARVLYHSLPCSPCKRRPTCGGDFTCMRRIQVDEVVEAARALLGCAP